MMLVVGVLEFTPVPISTLNSAHVSYKRSSSPLYNVLPKAILHELL